MTSRECAIVTGVSSGIGAATVRALAGSGYDVIACARRIDRLDALAGENDAITAQSSYRTTTRNFPSVGSVA
jgi:NADP-dependent 3-hydroxy acid dehydrogenase YdfG